jgi:hypothetical protein
LICNGLEALSAIKIFEDKVWKITSKIIEEFWLAKRLNFAITDRKNLFVYLLLRIIKELVMVTRKILVG